MALEEQSRDRHYQLVEGLHQVMALVQRQGHEDDDGG